LQFFSGKTLAFTRRFSHKWPEKRLDAGVCDGSHFLLPGLLARVEALERINVIYLLCTEL
jgi:hypothetical protein